MGKFIGGSLEVTVDWLHENGRYGATCDCGWEDCEGFQMAYREEIKTIEGVELRVVVTSIGSG